MSEELGREDISALWGPQGKGVLEPPARPRSLESPARRASNGHDQDERLVALERDLRQLVADLTQRLERLEREVSTLGENRRASLARISRALKGH